MNLNLVRRFFKFTVPSIVSMWIFSLYSLVDGMFVAWGVGEHALTAVNLSLPFVSLVFTLGILLATGTSTVLSIALGQKDVERARNYFNQNLFVVIAATLLLAVLVLFNLDWVADFLGATGENHHLVKEYVGVIACFSVFFTVSYNLEVQVKADGAPHVSIIGVISCGLMNVVLDYIFVMHLHWGVWGAALATGLAQATSTAVFVVYFLTHRYPLRFGRFKPDPGAYRRIIPLGTADGLSELSNGMVIFLFNHIIQRVIGPDALVSYTIISYVNTLVLNSVIGIAHGIQPLCSYHLGAEERPVCHKFLTYGIRLAACFAAGFFVLCQVLAGAVVGLFRSAAVLLRLPLCGLQCGDLRLLHRHGAPHSLPDHLLWPGPGADLRLSGGARLSLRCQRHLALPPGVRVPLPAHYPVLPDPLLPPGPAGGQRGEGWDTGCQAAGLSLPAAWQNGAWQKAMRRSLSEHSFRQAVQTF